jgi:hypothetical protein
MEIHRVLAVPLAVNPPVALDKVRGPERDVEMMEGGGVLLEV